MSALTGTAALVRHALRQDRFKLPIWIVGLAGLLAASAATTAGLYPVEADRVAYATASAVSVVARAFNGATSGPHLGSIIMIETFSFIALLAALMNAQTVVRHTRREEESGRSELVGASVVGRFAPLATALLVAAIADAVLAVLVAAVFLGNGMPFAGSLGVGAAIAGVGLAFAGIAAIGTQVMDTARAANGIAGALVGLAFLLRAAGDALGRVSANGMEVISAWPSWLSPFGWGIQLRPFSQGNWAVFIPIVGLSMVTVAIATVLNARRDLGSGMLPTRPGPANAPRSLRSPLGLAWRLQRGMLLGWAMGIAVLGGLFGSLSNEINTFVGDNERMRTMIEQLGGTENITRAYLSLCMGIFALVTSGYAVQSLLRLRTEETGPLETVLATSVSRYRWLASHVICAVLGSVALLTIAGLTVGLAYGMVGDEPLTRIMTMLRAGLVQVPAVGVLIAFIVVVFALLPERTAPIAWSVLAACVVVMEFGSILDLPQWMANLSPYTHIPAVPADPVTATPLITLTIIAVLLCATGFIGFRRRNVRP